MTLKLATSIKAVQHKVVLTQGIFLLFTEEGSTNEYSTSFSFITNPSKNSLFGRIDSFRVILFSRLLLILSFPYIITHVLY